MSTWIRISPLTISAVSLAAALSMACSKAGGGESTAGGSNNSSGSVGAGVTNSAAAATGQSGEGSGTVFTATTIGEGCGNGTLDSGEECDDGNQDSLDGCNGACQKELDFECPTPGQPCVSSVACGDGRLSTTEACDDSNNLDGDGCSADCSAIDPGWQCRVPGRQCVPLCGDATITASENCDDGNAVSGDGCSSTCLTEPGWSCEGTTCTQAVCGNEIVETGESCDAGEDNGRFYGDASGCSKTCTLEPQCREGGTTTACTTACGDGNIDLGEVCDDGNAVNGDGCSADCMPEAGFMCDPIQKADTTTCSSGAGDCLALPVVYRDFDGQNLASGHPDFFFFSSSTQCVPNASGSLDTTTAEGLCWASDSTDLCPGLVADQLGADGKPVLGPNDSCDCRFTDWDQTGIISGGTTCTVEGDGSSRTRVENTVKVIQSADSFAQWYHPSEMSDEVLSTLELASIGNNQFQFSSSNGRTVYDDIHDIFLSDPDAGGAGTGAVTTLESGFFPLEDQTRPKTCNIWPYWATGLDTTCRAADGLSVWSQWDPRGSYTAGMAGTGGPVSPVTGLMRNFYFTSEVRYLFIYTGGESLEFYGDDDVWVFINGRLVLDLGAPHERLLGSVTLTDAGADWEIQNTNLQTGVLTPVTSGTVAAAELGLEVGKVYEIAVFHADRHPRESNYQLTVSGFSTTQSACIPECGDGAVTTGEECDDGAGVNEDGLYGGCSTTCKFGPFCGDGEVNGAEECDMGRDNVAIYGQNGCTPGCTLPHFCGDGIIDSAYGEECDDGDKAGQGQCTNLCKLQLR